MFKRYFSKKFFSEKITNPLKPYENNKTHFAQFNELEISLQNKNKSIPFSNEIDIYNYTFETEKINMQLKKKSKSNDTNQLEFKLPIKKVYDVNFSVGEFAMQLNPTFNNLTYSIKRLI